MTLSCMDPSSQARSWGICMWASGGWVLPHRAWPGSPQRSDVGAALRGTTTSRRDRKGLVLWGLGGSRRQWEELGVELLLLHIDIIIKWSNMDFIILSSHTNIFSHTKQWHWLHWHSLLLHCYSGFYSSEQPGLLPYVDCPALINERISDWYTLLKSNNNFCWHPSRGKECHESQDIGCLYLMNASFTSRRVI